MPEQASSNLAWAEVEPAAEEAFSMWMGQPDLAWAKQAWEAIAQARLADYCTELERCQVAIRFLALCGIYQDFCWYAWEEVADLDFGACAELLNLTPFRVG
jgi:hypothetical protein